MDTQPKNQPKRSQLLLDYISKRREIAHEKSRTPNQKALIRNKKNMEKSEYDYLNK